MKTPPPNFEAPSRFRLALASGISCCALMLLFGFGYWAWAFRDGFKAGFVESSGTEAWRRFFAGFWPFGLLCLGLSWWPFSSPAHGQSLHIVMLFVLLMRQQSYKKQVEDS